MRFIKHRLLARRARAMVARLNHPRHTINYKDAKRIGVLVEGNRQLPASWVKAMRERLLQEGKEVEVLAFYSRPSEATAESPLFFTSQDISFSGKIEAEQVKKFAETDFDYLYCISNSQTKVFDSILATSRAKCRVGPYGNGKDRLLEMMIHFEQDQNQGHERLMDEMLKYTKAIAYN